jgi:XTP/dITP diphosphohydrolase
MNVLLASGNRHKYAEYQRLFSGTDVRVMMPRPPGGQRVDITSDDLDGPAIALAPPGVHQLDVVEDGGTFEANALKKATAYVEAYGRPCLADDSGICVDTLAGAPGVRSARFGGLGLDDAGRTRYLTNCLAAVPPGWRGAHYVCVLVLARPGLPPLIRAGMLYGEIAQKPGTGSTGFGYDPVFLVPGFGLTVADMSPEQKDSVSHRGLAARRLLAALPPMGQEAGTLEG